MGEEFVIAEFLLEAGSRLGLMFLGHFAKEGWQRWRQRDDICRFIPDIYGTDLLCVILQERCVQPKELVDVFGSEAQCHEVLDGRQELTLGQIQRLSRRFAIPPIAFFPLANEG